MFSASRVCRRQHKGLAVPSCTNITDYTYVGLTSSGGSISGEFWPTYAVFNFDYNPQVGDTFKFFETCTVQSYNHDNGSLYIYLPNSSAIGSYDAETATLTMVFVCIGDNCYSYPTQCQAPYSGCTLASDGKYYRCDLFCFGQ